VLDVVVNKPFKDHLRQLYSDWLLEGNLALTPGGKLKKPSVTMLGEWIRTAKKCFISNVLDGTEDDILWQDVDDENDDIDYEDDGDEQSDSEDSQSQFPKCIVCLEYYTGLSADFFKKIYLFCSKSK
jgi:hypothetical protein